MNYIKHKVDGQTLYCTTKITTYCTHLRPRSMVQHFSLFCSCRCSSRDPWHWHLKASSQRGKHVIFAVFFWETEGYVARVRRRTTTTETETTAATTTTNTETTAGTTTNTETKTSTSTTTTTTRDDKINNRWQEEEEEEEEEEEKEPHRRQHPDHNQRQQPIKAHIICKHHCVYSVVALYTFSIDRDTVDGTQEGRQ